MKAALSTLILLLAFAMFASAQPSDPGGGGNPTVPISGIEFLIGGGLLMGLRKFLRNKSK